MCSFNLFNMFFFSFLQCHTFVEEHEELVEKYWHSDFAKNKGTDFFLWLCIENVKGWFSKLDALY